MSSELVRLGLTGNGLGFELVPRKARCKKKKEKKVRPLELQLRQWAGSAATLLSSCPEGAALGNI